ncbi:MAG: site-2 protease family protein, partial [Legionella sp.]|nr:site-2 protease family protein [Legionella sp.]
MPTLSFLQTLAVWIVPVLLAITLHEAAHAWAAHRCGDSTAKMLGRLSMNPFRHIDLVGTVLVPLAVAVMSNFQFVFGWAKPV